MKVFSMMWRHGLSFRREKGMIAVAILATAAFVSCFQNIGFYEYRAVNIDGWERNDFVDFHIQSAQEDGYHTEIIGVRADHTYPFKSLQLIVSQNIVSTTKVRKSVFRSDTLSVDIYDDEGMMAGSGVNLHQYEIPFKSLRLEKGDSLYMTIRHNMSRRRIKGISDVGVKIYRPH